jgi:putative ABC transport system permease protein
MTFFHKVRAFVFRVSDPLLRRRREDRLAEELRSHLDLLTDEYVAKGMPAAEARAAARRAFGGESRIAVLYREQRGLPAVDTFLQDAGFAMRLLRRNPGFATIAVTVLALGIGVNNMLFTVLNAHTIRGLPLEQADRVIYASSFDDRRPDMGISYPDFLDLREGASRILSLAAFTSSPVALADTDRAAERVEAAFTSADAFSVLDIKPLAGRAFQPNDERQGAALAVVLGGGVWQSRYGASTDVIGRSVLIDRRPAEVIGILPDQSGFPSTAAIFIPLRHAPGFAADRRGARSLRVVGRLRGNVPVSDAAAEMESIALRLSQEFPETNRNVRVRLVPINRRFLGRLSDPAWLAFMTAGFLVVAISCANVANLMLGRSVHRTREIAIRASLGASRARVVRQLVVEGSLLAALAGSLGLGVAAAGLRLFRSAIPPQALPYWMDYSVDARVLAALVLVSAGTVLVFAVLPAFYASRTDVSSVLKNGETGERGGKFLRRATTSFVVVELALAVVLLAQLSLSFRTDRPPLPTDRVLEQARVLTAMLTLPPDAYRAPDQRVDFHRRLADRLRGLAGVEAVSLADALPLGGAPEQRVVADGVSPGASPISVRVVVIGPRYFETLGVPLVRGSGFAENGATGAGQVIVNERFVERTWGGADPLGRRLSMSTDPPAAKPVWMTVIGVAPDVRQRALPDAEPVVYVPYARVAPATATLMLNVSGEMDAVAALLRDEVRAMDANLPLYRMQTLAAAMRDGQWNGRLAARLVIVLTLLSVALATFGLYAVTAHAVALRTREIGLRVALGAGRVQVLGLVFRRATRQLILGFALGVILVMGWSRVFPSGQSGVNVLDWQPLAIVAAVLAVASVVACGAPAWRATRLDPVAAMRQD